MCPSLPSYFSYFCSSLEDVDPPPSFSSCRASMHLSPFFFGDFGLVVRLITSRCPLAYPEALGRQPEHVSFLFKLWLGAPKGASFLCVSFLIFIATKDFAFDSYIFLGKRYFPPRLPLLSIPRRGLPCAIQM